MRVAIYCRVSTDDQADRGTVQNQIEFANKYCDLHQHTITKWYIDDGISGTIPLEQRPEGAKLVEDLREKQFDILLVYKLDRLGRSARIILNAVYDLEQAGVVVKSMTEPFDTGDPSGRFLLTILAGVADLERDTIVTRLWHGANRAAREGRWLGGIVAYGYRVVDGYLEVNKDPLPGHDMSEADVIRMMYHLIGTQGLSTIKVADYLNALRIPTSYTKDGRMVTSGKRKVATTGQWTPGRVRNMIVNTTYKGVHQYGKRTKKDREIITRKVPSIVTEELWEAAQKAMQNNFIEAFRSRKREYLLRGLIKCSICGLNYCGGAFKGPGGALKPYYVCNGKTTYRGKFNGKCPSKNLPAVDIEEQVWNECVRFINDPDSALSEISTTMENRKSEKANYISERTAIEQAISTKETEKQPILDLFRRNIISAADVEQQFTKITQETERLRQRLKELDKLITAEDTMFSKFDTAEALLLSLREKLKNADTFEARREIVKTIVDRVEVKTETKNNRPQATVTTQFIFSRVTPCTDKGY
ncbi:recombinase family protein [Heliobacillus mobilis]|uniref:Recombinase family protein n=1 Tax=Heliobacterium mobile TaxID=28064 RepID=A0A6I3SFB3_HELMO|nr:recombinase family protein [Heliobacterium mobile]MTV47710.1 recombinase family protein [Heliobacterium mobile]